MSPGSVRGRPNTISADEILLSFGSSLWPSYTQERCSALVPLSFLLVMRPSVACENAFLKAVRLVEDVRLMASFTICPILSTER
jgi:hypothetical protein